MKKTLAETSGKLDDLYPSHRTSMAELGRRDCWPELDVAWAQTLLPPSAGVGISKDTRWRFRWIAKYPWKPTPPYQFSKSWKMETKLAQMLALRDVLAQVWQAHTESGGGECPFNIADLEFPA